MFRFLRKAVQINGVSPLSRYLGPDEAEIVKALVDDIKQGELRKYDPQVLVEGALLINGRHPEDTKTSLDLRVTAEGEITPQDLMMGVRRAVSRRLARHLIEFPQAPQLMYRGGIEGGRDVVFLFGYDQTAIDFDSAHDRFEASGRPYIVL